MEKYYTTSCSRLTTNGGGRLALPPYPMKSHGVSTPLYHGYHPHSMRYEEGYQQMRPQIIPYEMSYYPPSTMVYEDIGYHMPLCGPIVPAASGFGVELGNCDKSRQLPCKTFLSVGCCPYRDRCVYIHDPRLASVSSKSKSRKKNKEDADTVIDSFYWPALPKSELNYSLQSGKNKPEHGPKTSVFQVYTVPSSFAGYSGGHLKSPFTRKYNDNDAMYSMWNYFVEVCQENSQQEIQRIQGSIAKFSIAEDDHDPPDAALNRFTHTKRLQIFVKLATTGTHNANEDSDESSIDEDMKLESYSYEEELPLQSSQTYLKSICYSPYHLQCCDPYRISPISVVNTASPTIISPIRPSFSQKSSIRIHCPLDLNSLIT